VLAEKYKDRIEQTLRKYPDKRSAVMPVLHLAQEEYGYITPQAVAEVAAICGMTPTQVRSIAGFYTMFFEKPKGKYHIQVCTDLPCALRGAEQFYEELKAYVGIEEGQVTEDGLFSIERVMCLAACDKAPVMQINFSYCEGLDIEKAKALIEDLRAGREYKPPKAAAATEKEGNGRKRSGAGMAAPKPKASGGRKPTDEGNAR
jgi:NADH-quinone oxidoreductase subunit E